jgi:hypothetical protein
METKWVTKGESSAQAPETQGLPVTPPKRGRGNGKNHHLGKGMRGLSANRRGERGEVGVISGLWIFHHVCSMYQLMLRSCSIIENMLNKY